jgi:hypothetical protein
MMYGEPFAYGQVQFVYSDPDGEVTDATPKWGASVSELVGAAFILQGAFPLVGAWAAYYSRLFDWSINPDKTGPAPFPPAGL